MDQYKLIETELLNETQKKSSNSRGKLLVSTVVALAAAYVAVQTFSGPSDNQLHQRQTLWSNDKLTLSGWKTLYKLLYDDPIIKIGVTSRGRIYAVQNATSYQNVHWFNTTSNFWSSDYSYMKDIVDVQFDQSGIKYSLSSQNKLASSASGYQTLPGIKKFAVSIQVQRAS
ncbi:UNKNOWN [Stylonychia lemnae]|uniref:Uncharacterized protein n=1 Tax=Stylonychia lemnae TaxID=5949 RepID=A0A078AWH9_STYLE|nr:UNKNOWN [Stylonychia lemnae]|eukprot:CDW85607.1 UNKNOWN [Stylonychia lemnae]